MTEDFLQFIWKYDLFSRGNLITDTGEIVDIIALGEHNTDSGPDFINSRIKIGNTVWAGNVEIHLKSSDWVNHKHQNDKSYNNVILHVVYTYDEPVIRSNGEILPTVELTFDNRLYINYNNLIEHKNALTCKDKIKSIDPLIIDVWINSLVVERLEQKTFHLSGLLEIFKNSWEEVFYVCLARSFGFGLNSTPFEITARSVPLAVLSRHRDSLRQIEALFMGQAGFLNDAILFNTYYSELQREYSHLKNKYNLHPVEKHLWKFMRLRPVNFPTLRLAQFSAIIQKSESLFSKVISCSTIQEIKNLFEVTASEFWNDHYTFDTTSPLIIKKLGNEAVNSIIINAIVPLLFKYGKETSDEDIKERAISFLNEIPSETNNVVRRWEKSGLKPLSAFYSQGLLQLNNLYCNQKKCLSCSIGTHVITSVI